MDGLRALALALTLYHHWLFDLASGAKLDTWLLLPLRLPIGGFGVMISFVLSGFLVTGILRAARDGGSRTALLRNFYIRRALRIFPIFFITIGLAAYVGLPPFRDSFWWHALYLTNVYIFFQQQWIGSASHLWSLAVEEQFYLFWPILLLFFRLPFRLVCIALVLCGAIAQLITLIWFPGAHFVALLPVISMAPLAVGALLTEDAPVQAGITWVAWPFACLWAAIIVITMTYGSSPVLDVGAYYGALAASVLLVQYARLGIGGWFGWMLGRPWVSSLVVASYGMYLYHNFAGGLVDGIFGAVSVEARLILMFCVTLALACASWFLIERPINQLKRHFPYRAPPRQVFRLDSSTVPKATS